jgi:hypothetical protein
MPVGFMGRPRPIFPIEGGPSIFPQLLHFYLSPFVPPSTSTLRLLVTLLRSWWLEVSKVKFFRGRITQPFVDVERHSLVLLRKLVIKTTSSTPPSPPQHLHLPLPAPGGLKRKNSDTGNRTRSRSGSRKLQLYESDQC